MVPLLRVSCQGCVTPLLEGLLLMISAVWRNCLICSLVSGVSSAACAANGIMAQARTTKRNLAKGLGNSCMGCPPEIAPLYTPGKRGDNTNRCGGRRSHRLRQILLYTSPSPHYSLPRVFLPL